MITTMMPRKIQDGGSDRTGRMKRTILLTRPRRRKINLSGPIKATLSRMVPTAILLLLLQQLQLIPNTSVAAFTLITFDVDGTLVKGSGQAADASAHARAFSYAVGKVLGDGKPVAPVAQALPRHEYHGSTDGLILCRLARATLGIPQDDITPDTLQQLFATMYEYIADLDDAEIAKGIQPLPGVLQHLNTLASLQQRQQQSSSASQLSLACGLVTGNVEGIARRKMRAVGVWQTGALAAPAAEQRRQQKQNQLYQGTEDIAFLGGFGSDYCSRDIMDPARNYLDRGEQIAIAAQRCRSSMLTNPNDNSKGNRGSQVLSRVVHVGDAPADVLAAKAYAEGQLEGESLKDDDDTLCIGMVAVATGSYGADQLREAAGKPIPGRWEPVVLEQGMADPGFLEACGISF